MSAAAQVNFPSDSALASVLRCCGDSAWKHRRGETADEGMDPPVGAGMDAFLEMCRRRQFLILTYAVCAVWDVEDGAPHLRGVLWRLKNEFDLDLTDEAAQASKRAAMEDDEV